MQSDDPTSTRTSTLIRRKPRISGSLSSGDALLRSCLCKDFWRPTYVLGTNPFFSGVKIPKGNDHERRMAVCMTIGLALNVALNFWLIPSYGPRGAAISLIVSDACIDQ